MLLSLIMLIALLVYLWLQFQARAWKDKADNRLRQAAARIQKCRQIVDFTYFGDRTTLHDRLYLRAQPNQRLLDAFGIRSSFTQADEPGHHGFLRIQRRLLNGVVVSDWTKQYLDARTILGHDVKAAIRSQQPLRLAPCVRKLCWRVVSALLFKMDAMSIPERDVALITEEINLQWQRSKCESRVRQSEALNLALERVFGSCRADLAPTQGLALIMPAYETLWRQVPIPSQELGGIGNSPQE